MESIDEIPSWSIWDPANPPPKCTNTHWIMVIIISSIDKLYCCVISLLYSIWMLVPNCVRPNSGTDEWFKQKIYRKNLFSGDFFELGNRGLFRFILDQLILATDDKPYSQFRLCTENVFVPFDIHITKQILESVDVKRGSAYKRLTKFFGKGIFTSWIYNRWRHQKNIGIKLLHGSSLKEMGKNIYAITIKDLERYHDKAKGEPIDLVLMLSRIGLYIFCDCVLGVDVRDIGDELAPRINRILDHINNALEPFDLPLTAAGKNFKADVKYVHNWMLIVLARVKQNIKKGFTTNVFINELLKIDEQQQVELMISMVLGGHETSGRLILGTLYEMMRNPIHTELVRAEIDAYVVNNQPLDHDAIFCSGKFKYCHLLMLESLRMYPPVWLLSRTPTRDIRVGEHNEICIKKGTMILLSPLIIQRQKKYWGNNSETFDPKRFSGGNKIPKFFPFAIGRERCPAEKFAIMEPIMIICALFRHFDIKTVNDVCVPQPMSAGTFRLFDQLPIILSKRKN